MEEKHDNQENVRGIHLLILFSYTIFCLILMVEDLFLKWERWALPLIAFALSFCWGLHLTQRYSNNIRLRFYSICEMITFFFYGIHETSFYDLAPVILVILMIHTAAEKSDLILNFTEVYFLTILYDLLFNPANRPDLAILPVTRLLLHLTLVLLGTWISLSYIRMRKTRDELVQNRIRELEDTNKRTEDFLTNVSHELRTPINVVTGISSVMLKTENNDEKYAQLISIRDAGHRLFDQIDDILDHTELHSGRLHLQEENYMISSLAGDLHAEATFLHPSYNLHLIFDIDPCVPAVLCGDSRKIKKILRHLIDNAMKFTQNGGAYVRITSTKRDYGINLQFVVGDTGSGISDEDLGRVTEQFYQGNSGTNRSAGGLGLGLPIVHGLISAMGGFLQIRSQIGEGSTIRVSIPQKVVDPTPCMTLRDADALKIAFYDRPESYEDVPVLDFYSAAISHLAEGLQVVIHPTAKLSKLKLLAQKTELTHVFVGYMEYQEDPGFFLSLTDRANVFVLTYEANMLALPEPLHLIHLPFNSFAIVNALNQNLDDPMPPDIERAENSQMICPGIRILVVDDEVMNLVVAKGIFKNYQLDVVTAQSGMEALEICRQEYFDLVFLDHMMPEMDGVELMKRMRSEFPDRTWFIVTLTANAVSSAREMFFREGFDEFLSKPLETIEFERVLRKLLPASAIHYIDTSTGKRFLTSGAAPRPNTASTAFAAPAGQASDAERASYAGEEDASEDIYEYPAAAAPERPAGTDGGKIHPVFSGSAGTAAALSSGAIGYSPSADGLSDASGYQPDADGLSGASGYQPDADGLSGAGSYQPDAGSDDMSMDVTEYSPAAEKGGASGNAAEYSSTAKEEELSADSGALDYVDAAGEEPEDPALTALEAAGFDTASGISYCVDNRDFYLTVVREFVDEAKALSDDLIRFAENSRTSDLKARIISIRDIARLVGAVSLEEAVDQADSRELSSLLLDISQKAEAAL